MPTKGQCPSSEISKDVRLAHPYTEDNRVVGKVILMISNVLNYYFRVKIIAVTGSLSLITTARKDHNGPIGNAPNAKAVEI
jgi:hypothetical protein